MPKTFMTAMYSRFASWFLYRLMIHCSRNVSFKDFQVIWNMAYEVQREAEWKRLKQNYPMVGAILGPQRNELGITKPLPDALVGYPAQTQSGGPQLTISGRLVSIDGREEKPLPDYPTPGCKFHQSEE